VRQVVSQRNQRGHQPSNEQQLMTGVGTFARLRTPPHAAGRRPSTPACHALANSSTRQAR
jgi:hypothetical protein